MPHTTAPGAAPPNAQFCLRAAANALTDLRFDDLLPGDLASIRADLSRVRGRLQLAEAAFTRQVAVLNAQGQAPHPVDEGTEGGKVPDADARRSARNAELLGRFPAIAALLGEGAISMAHVDALAVTWSKLDDGNQVLLVADDAAIAAQARTISVQEFARLLRRRLEKQDRESGETPAMRHLRRNEAWIDTSLTTGRGTLRADLSPEMTEGLRRLLQAECDRIRNDPGLRAHLHPERVDDISHIRAQALMNLVTREPGLLADGRASSSGRRAEVLVIIDKDTLFDDLHENSVCEWGHGEPISVAEARRIACEAGIYPVVLGGGSEILDLGRGRRLADRNQRRTLRTVYRTCAHSCCSTPFDECAVHHADGWIGGGPTDIANLFPICPRHHGEAHTNGWTYHLDEDRTLTIRRPDGTTTSHPHRPLAGTGIGDAAEDQSSCAGDGPPPEPERQLALLD